MERTRFDYFEYFITSAKAIKQSAEYLEIVLKRFNANNLPDYIATLHKQKVSADLRLSELLAQLSHEFIPPLQREDIYSLARTLNSVHSLIEEVVLNIYMFGISPVSQNAVNISQIITQMSEVLVYLAEELKIFKKSNKIKNYIFRINTLKNKGNKIYVTAVKNIFSQHLTDNQRFSWAITFKSIKNALFGCHNVAVVIEGIIINNA